MLNFGDAYLCYVNDYLQTTLNELYQFHANFSLHGLYNTNINSDFANTHSPFEGLN